MVSHVRLFATLWTVARQAPLSMGMLQQELLEWVAMPSPPPRAFPKPMIEPKSPTLQAESLPSEPPGKSLNTFNLYLIYFPYHLLHRGERVMLLLFSHSVLSHSCDPMDYSPQAPLSMGFPRQEYWSGLPFPSSGDIPDPGIKPASPSLQADSLPLHHQGSP